ncbi:hypothetical protein AAG663_07065 [Bacillus licheniformis]
MENIAEASFESMTRFYLCFFAGILATAVLSTLLYDHFGAGLLGCIGALEMISSVWNGDRFNPVFRWSRYIFMLFCWAAASAWYWYRERWARRLPEIFTKLQNARFRFTLSAISPMLWAAPVIGWFASMKNAVHYEMIRGHISEADPEIQLELSKMIRDFVSSGLSVGDAKNMAAYTIVANARKASALGAYHDLFTILLWLSIIMLAASIGKAATGKGRSLVQKRLRLPDPSASQQKEIG